MGKDILSNVNMPFDASGKKGIASSGASGFSLGTIIINDPTTSFVAQNVSPPSYSPGDLLIVMGASKGYDFAGAAPTGWTRVNHIGGSGSCFYYRISDGGANDTFGIAGAGVASTSMFACRMVAYHNPPAALTFTFSDGGVSIATTVVTSANFDLNNMPSVVNTNAPQIAFQYASSDYSTTSAIGAVASSFPASMIGTEVINDVRGPIFVSGRHHYWACFVAIAEVANGDAVSGFNNHVMTPVHSQTLLKSRIWRYDFR